LYPAYEGDHTPGWQVDLGLWMYDRLTGRPEKHRQMEPEEVDALAPGLQIQDLDRALTYTDAVADDARLTLAVAATAYSFGAGILTRVDVEAAQRDGRGQITGLLVRDLESDLVLPVKARVVVNATGVWTDAVRTRLGLEGERLRPSRGSHLVFPKENLPLNGAVTFPSPDDGRPVFAVPHPEGTLLGTTDLYHYGDLDDPRPSQSEVGYLLRAVQSAFPKAALDISDAVGAFAGLRPILDTHAENPSEASREEDIWEEQGMLSVAGGKLTTWRSTAEEAVDTIIDLLPEERARPTVPCSTAGTPLAGLAPADLGDRLDTVDGLSPAVAQGMARRLGGLAWHAPLLARSRRELQPFDTTSDLCPAEIRAHLRWGSILHLDDLLLRRVRGGLWNPAGARELLPALEPIVRREMSWRRRRWTKEEASFVEGLASWSIEGIQED
ncbi:MAG: FAD-dependent oxidoreductase, partial [Thermoanaerobaculales bacterium]|nr:FAD-dependent oxidoreductase [Thermoanaerobaculales bacterium]